jgi:pimeloyl-ACP methyl ester carboxylesterase
LSPYAIALLVLLSLLSLGFLVLAHLAFWTARFAPTGRPDEVHYVETADGWRLAVRRYRPTGPQRYAEPVLLWHGLAVNHLNLDWDPPYGLAQYLASRGYDCFVPSLRGNGEGDRPGWNRPGLKWGFSFDDHRNLDVPAVLAHVRAVTGCRRVLWVGHSMGGMLAYSLGGTPLEREIAGLVAVGSPSSFADQPYLRWLTWLGARLSRSGRVPQRWATRLLSPFTGLATPPFSELVIARNSMEPRMIRRFNACAFEDISRGLALQFEDWVNGDHFRSLDKSQDYQRAMARFTAPVLLVGGTADRLAPPGCMRKALARLGSEDKTLILCGREHGWAVDYGHGDLLLGRTAPDEVFPAIGDWLDRRATRLAGAPAPGDDPAAPPPRPAADPVVPLPAGPRRTR